MNIDKSIGLVLGKLLVAIAWADGELRDEEVQIVKDMVFRIPNLSDEEWASIEVYIDPSFTDHDLKLLVGRLKELIKSEEEKKYIIDIMQAVIYADGKVTTEEARIFKEMAGDIQGASTGYESKLEHLFESAKKRRKNVLSNMADEECYANQLMDCPIFARVFESMKEKGISLSMGGSDLEFLFTAGALLASVAQADGYIHPKEVEKIRKILRKHWNISNEATTVIAEIAINDEVAGLDVLRICRRFFSCTTQVQRINFIKALIEVIEADREVDIDEQDRLRAIATNLKIPCDTVEALMPALGQLQSSDDDGS